MPQKNEKSLLSANKISKTFDNGVKALVDFTTNVHRGEVVVLIGPSGSGKSTFLRCLNGLEEIDSGAIVIDGITGATITSVTIGVIMDKGAGRIEQGVDPCRMRAGALGIPDR